MRHVRLVSWTTILVAVVVGELFLSASPVSATPRIQLSRGGAILTSSGNFYTWSGRWRKGQLVAGGITTTFRVRNTGTSPLSITNFKIPGGYTVLEPLSTTIAPGAWDEFSIAVSGATGYWIGTIDISSNDPLRPTFLALIALDVVDPPQFSIERGGVSVPHGSTIDLGQLPRNSAANVTLRFKNIAPGYHEPVYAGPFQ